MSLSAPPANMTTPVAASTAPPPPPSAPSGLAGPTMPTTTTPSPPVQVVNNNNTDTPNRASPGHHNDTLLCHWGDCQQQFDNHVTLAAHLSEGKLHVTR